MKKFILLLLIFIPFNVFGLDIDLNSKSAIVINRTNDEILYEKNIHDKLEIASITKVMTVLVALENINDLESTININFEDININPEYVTIGLKEGMKISYKDLLYSTIMYSAADSATALANHVFDSYEIFINKMNEIAKKLNMKDTYFSNTVGYDDNNYSTTYDIYLLLDYALENRNFYEIYTCKKYYIELLDKTIGNGVVHTIEKYNLDNKGIVFNGTKTGYTDYAGLCFSGITKIHNNELLIITLGADIDFASSKNIVDSINLAKYFEENYSNRLLLNKNKLIDNIIYKEGKKEYNYKIINNNELNYFMDNSLDLNFIKVYYDGIITIDKTIKTNEKIGNIKVYYQDKLLLNEEVYFDNENIVKEEKEINYKNIILFLSICLLGLFIFRSKK